MISDRSDFRVQIGRLFVVMIRMSYRWICDHPFLLGFVGFLYCLHRTCPLLFSSLVAVSPVLVCTFVLLGTILSFGEPNIPEIEKEPETVHEAALFRTDVSRDATIVETGEKSFTVERFVSTEKDVLGDGIDDADRLGENQLSEVEDDGRSFDYRPLVDETHQDARSFDYSPLVDETHQDARSFDYSPLVDETHQDARSFDYRPLVDETHQDARSFDYRPLVDETLDEIKRDTQVRFEEKAFVLEKTGELIENGGKQVSGAEQSRKNGGSLDEIMDDSKEDQMDVSPVSPWRPMRHEEDEDDDADRDDSLDSGSDGAESSSPDASMTDIIPMLDELHPLLHSEAQIRGIGDGEGSDAASEGPHRSSSDEGMESDVDSESHGEEGDNENEEEDEDEEEEKKQDKEDESKSAIKWTEIDQRNVMDLGSLELERNQRLENLIARRRARHNMRLMAERNLIDFDSADIPFNMPPISTARQNPFDVPYDPYDDMGLPPIPGSAPSIMFARRNPFDLPYEPNEEKPDLKGDSFEEEFTSQQPKAKDPVFRRHESFSVGPSMLGGPRHDRLRPFFVLERLANEGTSYYPFERQLSEVSESKVSSVPDTESVCTVLEDDEKKVDEHDVNRETEIDKVDMSSDHDEEKSHSASDHDEEKSHSASDHDVEKIHSSEDSDFDGQDDSRNLHHDVAEIILGSAETHHEQSNMMEREISDKGKVDEEDSSDSYSSLSEKEEKIQDFSENEAMLILEQKVDLHEESGTSSQPSFRELEIHVARGVEDDYHHDEMPGEDSFITAHPSLEESAIRALCNLEDGHHEEPVYDSSPPSASRVPSFSSVSSDYKLDLPEKNGEEVQGTADKEREVYSETISPAEIDSTSDETATRTREIVETSTKETGEASHLITEVGVDGKKNATVSRSEFEDALLDPSSLPLDKNENVDHQEDDSLSVSSQEDLEELHEDVKEAVETRALDVSVSLVDLVSPREEEIVSTGMVEQHLPVEHTCPPLGYGDTREHVTTLDESPDAVHDRAETSLNRSVAEGIMHKEEEAQKQKGEASLQTFNADIPIDSYSTLSSGAVEYVETHSFNDEDVPQLEQYPIQSSVPEAKEETHPNQTMDIQVDSVDASGQNVGSEEPPPSESDRELTWSDKSVVAQSSLEPGEEQVPTRAGPVSVVFSRNITFHEYHDAPEDTAELSCLTSDTSSSPAESPEYTTPMIGEGSRAKFFQEAVYEELDYVVERLDQISNLHAISQSPPEVINEEADEIKEIDGGLLSELDTIGDFSVKEVVTDSEPRPSSIGSDSANGLTEALPVVEARSVEDIESAFQQIHEGSEVEDVILPSTVQDQLAQDNYGNLTEITSDLEVVEVTPKEDLDTVMNQAIVESMVKQPKSPESDGGSGEPSESLVEEKSLDETNVPLNNTPEKEEEEEEGRAKEITKSDVSSIVESLVKQPKSPESDGGSGEPSESSVEERSLDETNVLLNNTPEKEEEEESRAKEITTPVVSSLKTRSVEEIPKPSEPKEVTAMEVISERVVIPIEAIGSSNVTPSNEVVTEEANTETGSTDVSEASPKSKETPGNLGESKEQKGKTEEEEKEG